MRGRERGQARRGAPRNAGFVPGDRRSWRWVAGSPSGAAVVKFELLTISGSEPAAAMVVLKECEKLGALNFRGAGFAARDTEIRELSARIDGVDRSAEVNVAGLAKAAAAYSRRQAKDWYDIAFVLLHNDAGGLGAAAELVRDRCVGEIDAVATEPRDLRANFENPDAQGPRTHVRQMRIEHPISTSRLPPRTPCSWFKNSIATCNAKLADRSRLCSQTCRRRFSGGP